MRWLCNIDIKTHGDVKVVTVLARIDAGNAKEVESLLQDTINDKLNPPAMLGRTVMNKVEYRRDKDCNVLTLYKNISGLERIDE